MINKAHVLFIVSHSIMISDIAYCKQCCCNQNESVGHFTNNYVQTIQYHLSFIRLRRCFGADWMDNSFDLCVLVCVLCGFVRSQYVIWDNFYKIASLYAAEIVLYVYLYNSCLCLFLPVQLKKKLHMQEIKHRIYFMIFNWRYLTCTLILVGGFIVIFYVDKRNVRKCRCFEFFFKLTTN